jgi:hypothetical protein
MKMKIKNLTLLASLITLAGFAVEARAEKFLAKFSYTEYLTNEFGVIVTERDTTASEVVECAEDAIPPLDPSSLVLVYDTVTETVEVVKKTDGSTVCTVFKFSGGTTVTSADGKKQVRQAFLNIPDHGANAHGSITGRIALGFDGSGNLTQYTWKARFQASIPEDNEVIEGTLTTSKMFVPTNP